MNTHLDIVWNKTLTTNTLHQKTDAVTSVEMNLAANANKDFGPQVFCTPLCLLVIWFSLWQSASMGIAEAVSGIGQQYSADGWRNGD